MMKIAINTRFLLKGKMEGFGWYTYEICKRMVESHPEDEFYFFFDRPFDKKFVFADNVTPIILSPRARHPLLFYLWYEISVRRALRKYNPDVFFSPEGFLCLNSNTDSFVTIHDIAHAHYPEHVPPMMSMYYRHYLPKFVDQAKVVFTVSQFSKNDIVKTYGVSQEKVKVFPNGSRDIFQPSSQETKNNVKRDFTHGDDYFIYVGSIHPRKNMLRTLQAFNQYKMKGQPGKLVIVGRMAWKTRKVKKAIENSPFRDDIVLTGTVSDEKLVQLLGASKALLYLSLFEGFGMPIVEAMQCHVPVITSDRSSMPEVGGDAVIYVNPESVDSIVEAMCLIDLHPAFVEDLLFKSQEQMTKFDWSIAAKGIYSTFCEFKN